MLTVRTSENTVITSFRLIRKRQNFSSVRTSENTVRTRARIQVGCRLSEAGAPMTIDRIITALNGVKLAAQLSKGISFVPAASADRMLPGRCRSSCSGPTV